MPITHLNPKFDAKVGVAFSDSFTLPTFYGISNDVIIQWQKIPAFPPGLSWNGTTVTGTPLVAGTYNLEFQFLVLSNHETSSPGPITSVPGMASSIIWPVVGYIRDAADVLPLSPSGPSYPGGRLKQITTSLKTYNFGDGIFGATLKELADAVNVFFSIAGDPASAYVAGDQFLLSFPNGDVLESVTLADDSEVPFSTVLAPSGSTFVNNQFFGKDNPADAEYSWYTIIHTCAC